MKIQPKSKLIMIGDSITDCDRTRPIGEGLFGQLGKGYVSIIDGFLNLSCPSPQIRVINMGVSGNTVRDLKARWQTDVLDLKPDWLSIMIGINDVWRQFDSPLRRESHVSIKEYEQVLTELIQQVAPIKPGLVLMTPFFIEPNRSDAMRVMVDSYGQIVRELAVKHGAILVDTQAAVDDVLTCHHPMELASDRVHPMVTGHTILARAFLKAIDYVW